MATATSSNGINTNTLAHKDNLDQNATVGSGENFSGMDTIPSGSATEPTINSGMTVAASVLPVSVKQTGFRDLKNGADYRPGSQDTAKSSIAEISNNGGPREQMQGQRNSRNYSENGKAFRSTDNAADSDGGN
jgi:hypothetical protein